MRNAIDTMVTFRLKLFHYTITTNIEKVINSIQELIRENKDLNLEMVIELKKNKINYRMFQW